MLGLWSLYNKALFSRDEIKGVCLNGVLIGKGGRSLFKTPVTAPKENAALE